jgi:hypothetical protein
VGRAFTRAAVAVIGLAALCCSCGYRLVPMDRTVHLALSAEGAMHPDAVPAVDEALSARLHDEGVRLSTTAADRELDVVVLDSAEIPALPAAAENGRFEPTAWDVRLAARATLRRPGAPDVELGQFAASGLEATGTTASTDDRAQSAAFAAAAVLLAERIVAAALAAW